MKKKLMVFLGLALGFAPLALAQTVITGTGAIACGAAGTVVTVTDLQGLLCKTSLLLNAVIPVLIALGVVYFVWGVIQYMIGGDEEAKKKGRDKIIYGIIGLAVIIGLWGLVRILTNTFVGNTGNVQPITLPTVNY